MQLVTPCHVGHHGLYTLIAISRQCSYSTVQPHQNLLLVDYAHRGHCHRCYDLLSSPLVGLLSFSFSVHHDIHSHPHGFLCFVHGIFIVVAFAAAASILLVIFIHLPCYNHLLTVSKVATSAVWEGYMVVWATPPCGCSCWLHPKFLA